MRRMSRALIAGVAVATLAAACNGADEPEETPDTDETTEDVDVDDDEADDDEAAADGEGALGPYRLGWVLSYLSPEYAMADLYTSTGSSNYFGYASDEFDQALADANSAAPEEADGLYQEAEDILLADFPLIPMWYQSAVGVWSERVDNVVVDAASYVRAELIESEDGEALLRGCEPQAGLIPADTREVCGGRVVNQLFSGLTEVDAETGEPELLVAESIDTEDSVEWTITLNDGWTFHDGTDVTASSFVDAWNYAANPDNGIRGQDFFSQIEGFSEVSDGEADEMSGLEVVDDLTIEVTLNEPFAPFITKLSDSAFHPLPEAFFDDPDGFGSEPIGNGRFQVEGPVEATQEVAMVRYEDWAGDNPANLDSLTYVVYEDVATAYLDVQAGNLDVLTETPPEQFANAEDDFGDRTEIFETSSFTYLGFPMYNETFGGNDELRQALSLAIDREAIIDVIYDGVYTPATAIIPPVLDSHRADACEFCEFDPDRAQELFEEAGGYDDTMTLYFNSGAGHDEWIEAVANQWRDVLGIEDFDFQSLEFAQYLDVLAEGAGVQ